MRDDLAIFTLLTRRIWATQHMSHGMVVVLRHSDIMSGPLPNTKALLYRVICGFFQAVLLIFLTAILGSTYNSDILVASVFRIAFLAVIVISRTYSVYFCFWMERALGHILIEYHTPAQRNAIRTIIVGMPSVSVYNLTTGRNYRAGILVDPNCATRHSPTDKKRRKIVRSISTALARVAAGGFVMVINPNLWAYGVFYFF